MSGSPGPIEPKTARETQPAAGLTRPLVLVPVCVALGLLLAIGLAVRLTAPPAPGGLIGQPLPALTLPALDPDIPPINTADLIGQPFALNVYASWCAPCLVEHPRLMALAEAGVPIVGMAWRDGVGEAQAFLADNGNPYRVVGIDQNGLVGRKLGVTSAPETFLVDQNGVVTAHWQGALSAQAAQEIFTVSKPRH